MNFEVLQKLDKLEQRIAEREYEAAGDVEMWDGFDVVVSAHADDSLEHWVRIPTQSCDFHRVEARRRAVVTRYARELSWLFEQLRDIHPGEIERITDEDFYALLSDEANQYIEEHKAGATASHLLESVIKKVREIYR